MRHLNTGIRKKQDVVFTNHLTNKQLNIILFVHFDDYRGHFNKAFYVTNA